MEMSTPSNSSRSCIAQSLAGLAGMAFVAVTVVILMVLPAEAQLFNPNVYKRALASQDLYERLPPLLASVPMSYGDNPENDAMYLTPADMEAIFREILPAEQTQALLEEIIDQTLAYYNSTDPAATIQVSMVDLKTRLGGESGDRIMRQIVASWPPCTEIENQTWREALTADNVAAPECSPSQDILDEATPRLGQVFDDMVASIPDVADMTPKYIPAPGATGNDPRPTLMIIRWGIKLSPLLSIFLLALVTILGVRSRKSFFSWWGALFLIVGIATFLVAAVSGVMVEGLVASMSAEAAIQSEGGGDLIVAFLEAIRYILRGIGIRISILSALSGMAGLVMVITAIVIGRGQPRADIPYGDGALPRWE